MVLKNTNIGIVQLSCFEFDLIGGSFAIGSSHIGKYEDLW